MKLIDLLVKELPKRGGWPEGATHVAQDPDKSISFANSGAGKTYYREESPQWFMGASRIVTKYFEYLADDFDTKIVTREEYEVALNKPYTPAPGETCEVMVPDWGLWLGYYITAIDDDFAFGYMEDIPLRLSRKKYIFRKYIDKEREEAIDEIGGILFEMGCSSQLVEIAERIYDTGYRKQK